jgi:hypothetical protein
MAPVRDADRQQAWSQIKQEFSRFGDANGFEAARRGANGSIEKGGLKILSVFRAISRFYVIRPTKQYESLTSIFSIQVNGNVLRLSTIRSSPQSCNARPGFHLSTLGLHLALRRLCLELGGSDWTSPPWYERLLGRVPCVRCA